jgi:hypothetical protein
MKLLGFAMQCNAMQCNAIYMERSEKRNVIDPRDLSDTRRFYSAITRSGRPERQLVERKSAFKF